MNPKKIPSLCLAIFFMFAVYGCRQPQSQIRVGENPPRFILSDLKGNKVTAPDDYRGKVIIIRFWADWCTACAKEMPAIDYIYHKYKDRGLVVLAVNVGQPRNVAEAFVTNLKISYPVLLDPYSVTAKRYGVKVVPVTFILDRKGVIKNKIFGETDTEIFEKMITDLI